MVKKNIINSLSFNTNAYFYECLNRDQLEKYVDNYIKNLISYPILCKKKEKEELETSYYFVAFKKRPFQHSLMLINVRMSGWKKRLRIY